MQYKDILKRKSALEALLSRPPTPKDKALNDALQKELDQIKNLLDGVKNQIRGGNDE